MQNTPNADVPSLSSHEDAIVWFISQMDIEMVDDLLDANRTYQSFPKTKFITKLKAAFEQFKATGNSHLNASSGKCDSCDCPNTGSKVYIFYGNRRKDYMALIIQTDANKHVTDIFECSSFTPDQLPDFPTRRTIFIDKLGPPPF